MALKSTANGLLVMVDSPTGKANLYAALDWQRIILDTTSYVGTATNGGALGRIIAVNPAKSLVQLQLLKPVTHKGNVLPSYTAWAEAKLLSEYNPQQLDYTAMKYYYSTGNSVRIRSSASLVSLTNVVGKANKGDVLGKSDGYITNSFLRIYSTDADGDFLLDKSGNKIVRYVHKDYASSTNPVVTPTVTTPEPNEPTPDNGTPENLEKPATATNSVGIIVALVVAVIGFGIGVFNYVRNRAKTKKKP